MLFLAGPPQVIGAIYGYVDEAGVVTMTNLQPENREYRVILSDPGNPSDAPVLSGSSANEYDDLINQHAKALDVDPYLVKAVMMAESNGNPRAVSRKGAQGLMQIMPGTARTLDLQHPFDPSENIAAGTRYLKLLYLRFMGNMELVLAAYNAGPERVVESNMSVPRLGETLRYITRVKAYYERFKGL